MLNLQRAFGDLVSEPEADPFEQPYWNLDQYLIWLASRDPAAVLNATDRPNSDANPPSGWRVHREKPNVDRQKVERAAIRAIKDGHIKICIEFNGEWFIPDEPEEFADWAIDFEGEPTFAALLMRTTKRRPRLEVRPRLNPQRIRQRYRARTLSNICYRLDDPDVDRFIAYSDVWNWLAECISLRETLPIDEAGSRAEKTIRDICTNTPEKLTMWGLHKADSDAELKPVKPEAWHVLSINPLRDWATKDDGDEVIWARLRFDRKQLDAAFVTEGGNGPPTHTPVAQPTQSRKRTSHKRERARRILDELPNQANMSNKELVSAVNALLEERGQESIPLDTILRAAGRRK
jgi:hypothetical protein